MESKNQIRQRGQQLLSRYVDSASRIHISDSKQPLRWTAAVKSQAVPLLVKKWKVLKAPFGTGVDTHKRPTFGAAAGSGMGGLFFFKNFRQVARSCPLLT